MGNQRLAISNERLATPSAPDGAPPPFGKAQNVGEGGKSGQYDHWWDVPVVVSGTPNPEAVRLIEEAVREFEDSQFVKMDRPCQTPDCKGVLWMHPRGTKCGCDTCKSVFSIERSAVSD